MQVTEKLIGLSSASSPRPCRGLEVAAVSAHRSVHGWHLLGHVGVQTEGIHVYILLHRNHTILYLFKKTLRIDPFYLLGCFQSQEGV